MARKINKGNSKKSNTKRSFSHFEKRGRRAQERIKHEKRLYNEKEGFGVFHSNRHGYGFVSVDGSDEDIFIPARATKNAIEGDRVRITFGYNGQREAEGKVEEIREFSDIPVIGTLCAVNVGRNNRYMRGHDLRYYVVPDNKRLPPEITVDDTMGAEEGDKVLVELCRKSVYESRGKIIKNFGAAVSLGANYEAVLCENGIELDFEDAALKEAELAAAAPVTAEGREDIRDKCIFTIDGADAKDLDDAISIEHAENGNYLLGVHIADVSEYVKPMTALDRAVMKRGTSVYFTDKVVPMLPRTLSNGACSLNAGEDKYTLSAFIEIDREGNIKSTRITRSLTSSRVRGVYAEVNDIFEKREKSSYYNKYECVMDSLDEMYSLYKILSAKAKRRGSLELESAEARIILDENGKPCDIAKRERGEAEKLIEAFMLSANEGVATLLNSLGIPCVYRVHDKPTAEKLSSFADFIHNRGISPKPFENRERVSAESFAKVLERASENGNEFAISYIILRTMAKAKYSDKCDAHFGLGIEKYCHFTSPIRRLSDLATHRIIKAVLLDGEAQAKYLKYARRAAAAATEAELRAIRAEREIDDIYKCIYMEDFIGEEFDAVITMVTSFGIFAQLENTCEGIIPFSDRGESVTFDEKSLSVYMNGKKYTIADKIKVCVVETDVGIRRVRFELLG